MFRVGLTRDFLKPDGTVGFGDIGLDLFDAAGKIAWEFLPTLDQEILPEHAGAYDGLLVLAPRVGSKTLAATASEGCGRLKVVARFGVGYDNVDVPACTRAGVLLTITPDGVRRPVAVAAMTFLLALSHKLLIKDRLTRAGGWARKLDYIGQGVTGRTLGIIGLGNIGRELAMLARPFGLRLIACDPVVSEGTARDAGVALVSLEELLGGADYAPTDNQLQLLKLYESQFASVQEQYQKLIKEDMPTLNRALESSNITAEHGIANKAKASALFDWLSKTSQKPKPSVTTASRRRQPRCRSSWLDRIIPTELSNPSSCLWVKYPGWPIGDGGVVKT